MSFELYVEVKRKGLTVHPLGALHLEHVGRGHVEHRDALGVVRRHAHDGVADHLEGPVLEGPHGVDPRLLGRVDEAAVDPARHPVQLERQGNVGYGLKSHLRDHGFESPDQIDKRKIKLA